MHISKSFSENNIKDIKIIKDVGFRSMRVKYKEENSLLSENLATFRWLWVWQPHQALLN